MTRRILEGITGRRKRLVPEPLRSMLIAARQRQPYPSALICGCGANVLLSERNCPGCGMDAIHAVPRRAS